MRRIARENAFIIVHLSTTDAIHLTSHDGFELPAPDATQVPSSGQYDVARSPTQVPSDAALFPAV
jgi:hypothetical protein